uniref:Uncharacterized protein n=1 Tax=Rhizophora mucronata TaxID=61149 RepID=A0A2P2PGR1_RHIMU
MVLLQILRVLTFSRHLVILNSSNV